jgi:hypothetical protein
MRKFMLVVTALLVMAASVANAQDVETRTQTAYFVAADANGVQQIFQMVLDGQSAPRQITHAASDVINFGVAYDGLSVAYISAGQLLLQPIHTETPESLVLLSATQFLGGPVYSPDGQYIAYPDNGVWLLDLGTRQTHQLLADIPLEESAANTDGLRRYLPKQFVPGDDGTMAKLVVDVGIWEWNSDGVYDLATGALQELAGQTHTDLLPLNDGRVLLYGNGGVAGEPFLHIAASLDDINTNAELLNFGSFSDAPMFASQAIELKPGLVRVFGSGIATKPTDVGIFYFDYDLATNAVSGNLNFVGLSPASQSGVVPGQLSPDGLLLPVYTDALWTDGGNLTGGVELFHILSGETITAAFPKKVSVFHWQQ